MKRTISRIAMAMPALIFGAVWFGATRAVNAECIQSYHNFAYEGPILGRDTGIVAPRFPWQAIPSQATQTSTGENDDNRLWSVVAARPSGDEQEIWTVTDEVEASYAVYHSGWESWEFIPHTFLYGDNASGMMFTTEDNHFWSQGIYPVGTESPPVTAAVLGIFDDESRRFVPAPGSPELPMNIVTGTNGIHIVLDHDDIFWIFAQDDGIHRYDPQARTSERVASFNNREVMSTSLAPDGSIYLQVFRDPFQYGFRVRDDAIYQFLPDTAELTRPPSPEGFPLFNGLILNQSGQLWIGSSGYRDQHGEWVLTHPDSREFFGHQGDYMWSPPSLIFESSDGRLWYRRWLDTSGIVDGAAWFNPLTGEGCQFTTMFFTSVVEDSAGQLWSVAGSTLYFHPSIIG